MSPIRFLGSPLPLSTSGLGIITFSPLLALIKQVLLLLSIRSACRSWPSFVLFRASVIFASLLFVTFGDCASETELGTSSVSNMFSTFLSCCSGKTRVWTERLERSDGMGTMKVWTVSWDDTASTDEIVSRDDTASADETVSWDDTVSCDDIISFDDTDSWVRMKLFLGMTQLLQMKQFLGMTQSPAMT